MQFAGSLKKLLTGFVEVYQTHFLKTYKFAFLLAVLCCLTAILLAAFTDYDHSLTRRPIGTLSYFLYRYSYKGTYSFVDLVKTVFIFLVAIFSINLIRKQEDTFQAQLKTGANRVTFKDIFYLFWILIACVFLDCALFRLERQLFSDTGNRYLHLWIHNVIFLLRIYLPLVLFSLIIQIRISKPGFTGKQFIFLFISLWLFNEVTIELLLFFRDYVFSLMLFPLSPILYFWFESILGIGLITLCFLGYYYAMTSPFKLNGEDDS